VVEKKLWVAVGSAALSGIGVVAGLTVARGLHPEAAQAAVVVPGVDPEDVDFGQCMIVHHAQAVEMAASALDASSTHLPEVVDLASRISTTQIAEIATMRGWLEQWGAPPSRMGHSMMLMSGMQSDDAMNSLNASAAETFDTRWLEMMNTHHRGGISMSRHVVEDGEDPEVWAAAEAMIAVQTAEIAEMEALLGR
jgi:uncharacterized protein (DUF305 family)